MASNSPPSAPCFALPDQNGRLVRLADLCAKGPVVVFFYPKDETPGCTAEVCAFRDHYEAFAAAGASVVGISSDSIDRHQRFADRHALPFTLLSDANGEVRRAFGVPRTLGLLPGRATYVLDRQGLIRHRFVSQLNIQQHVQEALPMVRALASE